MKIQQIYDLCKGDAKRIMLYLRKEENINDLVQETSYLPNSISKSERYYCWLNKLKEIPKCPICSKLRMFHKVDKGYFSTCGDKACKSALIAKANKEYPRDWKVIQEKMKATYKAKTGYEHNMQNPEFKKQFFDNYKQTHNGDSCGVQSKKAIENLYKTLGKKHEESNDVLIQKVTKMGYEFIQFDDYAENKLTVKCNRCNNTFQINRSYIYGHYKHSLYYFCPYCDINGQHTIFEQSVLNEIKQFYNGTILHNCRTLTDTNIECDIVIPDYKLAIECNGLYWHSDKFRNSSYHFNKKKDIEETGYNLIQIWEDDWYDKIKHDIIISRIKNKLGMSKKIYARNCIIKEVQPNIANEFLNENHLQGSINSTYKFGLFYNDELVMLMTIGKSRKLIGNNKTYELYRLCTKKDITVIGGFSKLLEYFRSNHKGETLISYVDCDWCQLKENGYNKVGFEFIKHTAANYWWCKNIRENRLKYTKSSLVKQGYNKDLSETEIMKQRGYFKIYGSGNLLYSMTL